MGAFCRNLYQLSRKLMSDASDRKHSTPLPSIKTSCPELDFETSTERGSLTPKTYSSVPLEAIGKLDVPPTNSVDALVSPRKRKSKHKRGKSTDKTATKRKRKKKLKKKNEEERCKAEKKKKSEAILETVKQLTKDEFEVLTDQFKALDKKVSGKVDFSQFRSCLGLLGNPQNDITDNFAQIIFNGFDDERKGFLVFPEFLVCMSILLKGTTNQKLEFAFSLCDADNDGKIVKKDLDNVIGTMYGILTNLGITPHRDACEVADSIFNAMDENGDEIITLQEYKDAVNQNPVLLQGLGLFDPKDEIQYQLPTHGVTVTFGHAKWGLMLNIMIGIRLAVPAAGELTSHLLPRHYTEKQKIPLEGNYTLDIAIMDKFGFGTEKMEENEFVNYCPLIFKKAREVCKISEASYMLSLGPEQLLGNMLCGKLASMKCKVSEGKSGSFFFTSHDGKYLVKTIYHREKVSLEKMLPDYFEYIVSSPNSLLNQIFGFHRIGLIPFIVLKNVFFTLLPIDEVYDLKGSEWGRTNTEGHGVLKDLDFKRKLNLTPEMKQQFLRQIEKDSQFLEKLGLIDYSLLLGIHYVDKHKGPKDSRDVPINGSNIFTSHHGGILSANGKEVYFIGIIDYLTVYGIRKTAETLFRSTILHQQRDKISTVPPPEYAERFRRYMGTIC